jgi:hypothetical protein
MLLAAHGMAQAQSLPPFSGFAQDTVFEPRADPISPGLMTWVHRPVRGISPNEIRIVIDPGGVPALRIQVKRSASALVYTIPMGEVQATANQLHDKPWLCWRWRASAFPSGAVLGEKSGDDFAARVYLMFDYPLSKVPALEGLGLRMARLLHDATLPAATLVYLLHQGADAGSFIPSPYTGRVRMRVASPQAKEGQWLRVCRNVPQDFQAAFGAEFGPGTAPLQAIAVGADGDQTSAELTAEFGDLEWRSTPY